MAQTKTRGSGSSSTRSGSKRKRSSSGGRSSPRSTKGKATQSGRTTTQNRRRQTGSQARGSSDGSAIGKFADKAKGPALAGGAALLGLAGGMAVTRERKRRGVLAHVPTPKLKAPSIKLSKLNPSKLTVPKPDGLVKSVGQVAGQVADRSHRVGEVATQVQRVSEAIDGQNKGNR